MEMETVVAGLVRSLQEKLTTSGRQGSTPRTGFCPDDTVSKSTRSPTSNAKRV